jgi:hypothetical protein
MNASSKAVTKAVIPVAGLGTRFLPATKATPKEMLPVVDKPAIQYVVEEAVASGLEDILLVTGRNKSSLENHFDRAWELEAALEQKGDELRLERVRKSQVLGDIHYVRQGDPRGLGHAVLCGALHVGDEPFAVMLGDDLIDPRDALLSQMLDVQQRYGGSVIALAFEGGAELDGGLEEGAGLADRFEVAVEVDGAGAVAVAEHAPVHLGAQLAHLGALGVFGELARRVVECLDLLGDGEVLVGDGAVGDAGIHHGHAH